VEEGVIGVGFVAACREEWRPGGGETCGLTNVWCLFLLDA
jgi:hypothetical protein